MTPYKRLAYQRIISTLQSQFDYPPLLDDTSLMTYKEKEHTEILVKEWEHVVNIIQNEITKYENKLNK